MLMLVIKHIYPRQCKGGNASREENSLQVSDLSPEWDRYAQVWKSRELSPTFMVALCGQRRWLKVKRIYAAISMVSYMPPKLRVAVQYGASSTSIGKSTYDIIYATAMCVQKQSLSVQLSEYFAAL